MKPFYKSLTFWSLVVTLLGLMLAGVGQGRPLLELLSDVEVQATLGEVLAALGLGGVLVGRARAQGQLTRGKGDESGRVDVGLILALSGLAFIALGWTVALGCGSRQVTATRSVGLVMHRGPPCDMSLRADGEEVCRVRSETERCGVTIDGEVKP